MKQWSLHTRDVPDIWFWLTGYLTIFYYPFPEPDPAKMLNGTNIAFLDILLTTTNMAGRNLCEVDICLALNHLYAQTSMYYALQCAATTTEIRLRTLAHAVYMQVTQLHAHHEQWSSHHTVRFRPDMPANIQPHLVMAGISKMWIQYIPITNSTNWQLNRKYTTKVTKMLQKILIFSWKVSYGEQQQMKDDGKTRHQTFSGSSRDAEASVQHTQMPMADTLCQTC